MNDKFYPDSRPTTTNDGLDVDFFIMKQDDIANYLRQQIAHRRWRTGDRIETREQLMEQFGCSNLTIQRAVTQLIEEGSVVTRRRGGTVVDQFPPCLWHYAIAIPEKSDDSANIRSRFWVALTKAAKRLETAIPGLSMSCMEHASIGDERASDIDISLLTKCRTRQLAGVFFPRGIEAIQRSALMGEVELPLVVFAQNAKRQRNLPEHIHELYLDSRRFLSLATQQLVQTGHRRIAVLSPPGLLRQTANPSKDVIKTTFDLLHQSGAKSSPDWILPLTPTMNETTQQCLRLLFNVKHQDRPDALILGDDHFVSPALQTLKALNLHPNQDIKIVAWTNFPTLKTRHEPSMCRIGFDVRQIMVAAMNLMIGYYMDTPPVRHAVIEVVNDSDIATSGGFKSMLESVTQKLTTFHTP